MNKHLRNRACFHTRIACMKQTSEPALKAHYLSRSAFDTRPRHSKPPKIQIMNAIMTRQCTSRGTFWRHYCVIIEIFLRFKCLLRGSNALLTALEARRSAAAVPLETQQPAGHRSPFRRSAPKLPETPVCRHTITQQPFALSTI